MSRTYVVCYLLLISSLGVSAREDEKSCWKDPWCWGPAVVVSAVGGAVAAPFALTALGFTAAGIKAGSVAASLMSAAATTGGGGGAVAAAQSAGAAGVAVTTKAAMAVVGGTIGHLTSGCSEPSCENEKN